MSTLVAEPAVQEVNKESHLISAAWGSPAQQSTVIAEPAPSKEMNPMLVVLIACVIAFHVAAAMIGSVVAWIYQLRHSGAFAP